MANTGSIFLLLDFSTQRPLLLEGLLSLSTHAGWRDLDQLSALALAFLWEKAFSRFTCGVSNNFAAAHIPRQHCR